MIEDILKSARVTAAGRRILSSVQKASIVQQWEQSGLSCPEFCRRHGFIASQMYKWRTDAKRGAIMSIRNQGDLHTKAELEMLRKENEPLRRAILQITGEKATYGTPRVRALLQRDHAISASAYMVHRCMKEEGLLICRNRRRGSSRPHTGTIAVEQPNTRWASDITSIKCWNGQKIRLAFVMDCCDRSILAWSAGAHMQACDIELMVQKALFKRFGEALPPEGQLQLLHDNGPEYIEKGLRKQLEKWNIVDCNTPTYSPQSNGMCEALNGTFKRDYVYEHCLDNPQVVIDQIQGWVDEYNGFAPHSALKMKTPNEYFNLKKQKYSPFSGPRHSRS